MWFGQIKKKGNGGKRGKSETRFNNVDPYVISVLCKFNNLFMINATNSNLCRYNRKLVTKPPSHLRTLIRIIGAIRAVCGDQQASFASATNMEPQPHISASYNNPTFPFIQHPSLFLAFSTELKDLPRDSRDTRRRRIRATRSARRYFKDNLLDKFSYEFFE